MDNNDDRKPQAIDNARVETVAAQLNEFLRQIDATLRILVEQARLQDQKLEICREQIEILQKAVLGRIPASGLGSGAN